MTPLRAFPVTTNSRALAFYQVGAEGYNYNTFAGIVYGNATGVEEFVPASLMTSAGAPAAAMGYFGGYNRRPCGSVEEGGGGEYRRGSCWAWMPSGAATTDGGGALADRALIVREWRAVLGGQPAPLPHLSLFKSSATQASLELSPPPGVAQVR